MNTRLSNNRCYQYNLRGATSHWRTDWTGPCSFGMSVQQVAVPWTMTATGVDHLYRGLLTIDCSVEAGVVMGMRDTPPDGE